MSAPPGKRHTDLFALSAACICFAVLLAYLAVTSSQGNASAAWVDTMLVGGGILAAYGSQPWAKGRVSALFVAAIFLGLLGVVSILSIGLPILVASALCGISAVRLLPSTLR